MTNGALTLTFALSPARFIAAAAAAARASSGVAAACAATGRAGVVAGRLGPGGAGDEVDEGAEAFLEIKRDMADLDAAAASDVAAGAGVPAREELGVQLCDVVCR